MLVIDDNSTARDLISEYLSQAGFAVITAAGGREGLELAKQHHPTAITLDVMMPELDGWTVLAALRGDPEVADIPVVMATIVDERKQRGHDAGSRRISHQADRTRQAGRAMVGAIQVARRTDAGVGRRRRRNAARARSLLARTAALAACRCRQWTGRTRPPRGRARPMSSCST